MNPSLALPPCLFWEKRWVRLEKGLRTRAQEESLVGSLLVTVLLHCAQGGERSAPHMEGWEAALGQEDRLEFSDESSETEDADASRASELWNGIPKVLEGKASHAIVLPGGNRSIDLAAMPLPCKCLVFPGSFNPLHGGHVRMAEAAVSRWMAEKKQVLPILYEITAFNADKGAIPLETVQRRVEQFSAAVAAEEDSDAAESIRVGPEKVRAAVAVTSVPLFSQKAELFPGSVFLVGADTAKRIVDPKYYGDDHENMVAAIAELYAKGCSFIVGGRTTGNGSFELAEDVLDDAALPRHLREMFWTLSEDEFRVDVSSTELRNAQTPAV